MEGNRDMSSRTDWARGGHRVGSSAGAGGSRGCTVEVVEGEAERLARDLRARGGIMGDKAGSGSPSSPRTMDGSESYATDVRLDGRRLGGGDAAASVVVVSGVAWSLCVALAASTTGWVEKARENPAERVWLAKTLRCLLPVKSEELDSP